jgi:hypothetical protein
MKAMKIKWRISLLSTIYELGIYLQESGHSLTDIRDIIVLNRHLKLVAKGSMFEAGTFLPRWR